MIIIAFYNFNQSNSWIWSKPLSAWDWGSLKVSLVFNSITWILLLNFLFRFLNYCMESTNTKDYTVYWFTSLIFENWSESHCDNLEDFSTFVSMECWDFLSSVRPLIGRLQTVILQRFIWNVLATGMLPVTNNYELLDVSVSVNGYCRLE